VYEAINACSDLLVNYGGHFYAAGLTLLPQNLEAFKARFESIVTHNITEAQKVPELVIDAPFNFAELKSSLYNILAQMAPFGPNNMKPVFIAYRAYDNGFTKIVKDKHIRFQLYQKGSQTVHGIGFNLADKFHLVEENKALDVVFTIEQNDWNNQSKIEIRVLDIRQSD
jgi:single-stranded-DNA-specific exonuclease